MRKPLALVAFVLAVVACGEGAVKKEDVEKIAMDQLTASAGKQAPQVTCPGDLKAKVGTTMICTLPVDTKVYEVTLKVTSVEGNVTKFDITVADNPRPDSSQNAK